MPGTAETFHIFPPPPPHRLASRATAHTMGHPRFLRKEIKTLWPLPPGQSVAFGTKGIAERRFSATSCTEAVRDSGLTRAPARNISGTGTAGAAEQPRCGRGPRAGRCRRDRRSKMWSGNVLAAQKRRAPSGAGGALRCSGRSSCCGSHGGSPNVDRPDCKQRALRVNGDVDRSFPFHWPTHRLCSLRCRYAGSRPPFREQQRRLATPGQRDPKGTHPGCTMHEGEPAGRHGSPDAWRHHPHDSVEENPRGNHRQLRLTGLCGRSAAVDFQRSHLSKSNTDRQRRSGRACQWGEVRALSGECSGC